MLVLESCVVHIFDKEIADEASKLCNLMGAMITDEIVPFFTTHIVVDKATP